MACATLKRSLNFDPLQSPRPTKRRRWNVNSPSSPSVIPPTKKEDQGSPFEGVGLSSRIPHEVITANLREEMRRLHRRKQLHFGIGGGDISNNSGGTSSGGSSPEHNVAYALSERELREFRDQREGSPSRDKPLFTFRQVGLICERLLREREGQLRDTYEQALSAKLSEQYDTFVKFTHDQIQKQFESNSAPSYLS